MVSHVLFDLDGTITDSGSGIMSSYVYALDALEIPRPSSEALRNCVGPPLRTSLASLGVSPKQIERAVDEFRNHYVGGAMFDCELIPGMAELVKELSTEGTTVALATSKPWVQASEILKHFDLYSCFDFISGAELDGTRSHKSEVVKHALNMLEAEADQALMIGDRAEDIVGARAVGVSSIGVTWGYGTSRELADEGAHIIVDTQDQLSFEIRRLIA